MKITEIINEFKKIKKITSIVLGGSSSAKTNDELSDFDIYIYSDVEILPEIRKQIAEKFASKFEINNQFFETGDEWILKDSKTVIDFMFRNTNWIEEQVKRVYENCSASVGYSTCFLYNVKNSEILYDTDNWFKTLQDKIKEYPDKLVKNIISKNFPLLKKKITASYFAQIEVAVKRNDLISVNHRLSAFLASYFDVIFAVNRLWHPGEKRLLKFSLSNCKILPKDFEKNIKEVFEKNNKDKLQVLEKIETNLKEIL